MSRLASKTTQVLFDLVLLSSALWLAFLLRFEGELPIQMLKRAAFVWPYVVGFQYLVLVGFGVPRFAWRYVGLRETIRVLLAAVVFCSVLLIVRYGAPLLLAHSGYAQYTMLPGGVILTNGFLAFLLIVGVRVVRRLQTEKAARGRRSRSAADPVPTMLVGAGQAGLLVAKEIATRPDLAIRAVGFLDDDPLKVGSVVHGIRVVGNTQQLEQHCERLGARQILITIANAPGTEIRRIKAACDEAGLSAKIIPGIYEIVGGTVNLSRIRDVSIGDLLGRAPVDLELGAISDSVAGRVVMVTGAGGSIGSELCRQICRFQPGRLLLVERAENSLFQMHRELLSLYPALGDAIVPCIADVCDGGRLDTLFARHKPSLVLHAAAHKHVPMMEWNPGEAIKNNIFGTKTVAELAHAHHVDRFVMVSTDKAVNPSSVMGATKRAAETYVQALSQDSQTRFVTVRFGNVLGSAGSVVPIFQEQIAKGGPVTVTDAEMKRYFMTIPEACQLVIQAASMGRGGEIFILDMGEPVRIIDLARDLIRLSGLRPEEDIEIKVTGVRPGEKLFEELSVAAEAADKTRHPKIFVGRIAPHGIQPLRQELAQLEPVLDSADPATLMERLRGLVPEFRRAGTSNDPSVCTTDEGKASGPLRSGSTHVLLEH